MNQLKSFLKERSILAYGLLAIIATGVLVVTALLYVADKRLKAVHSPAVEVIETTTDSVRLAHGEHLASLMCSGCHGYQFTGRPLMLDTSRLILYSSNLRANPKNKAKRENKDWYYALKHGLGSDGRSLLLMPSSNIARLTDEDLADIVSYLESLKPLGEQVPPPRLSSRGKIDLVLFGDVEWLSANQNYTSTLPDTSQLSHGAYLTEILYCKTCHGEKWEGKYFKSPVNRYVPPLNECRIPRFWTEDDFIRFMRTGIGDSSRHVRAPFNRNKGYRFLSYQEANSLYQYFQDQCPR